MTAPRTASELRAYLRRELAEMGWCDVEVASEFEWKAARRLARAVGRTQGFRVHSRLHRRAVPTDWPRTLTVWDPEMQADAADLRRAALALGVFDDGDR